MRAFLACLIAVGALGTAATAAPAQPLQRGFADSVWYEPGGAQWVPPTTATGARIVLLELDWAGAEPTAPASDRVATDPGAPQFSFAQSDAVVREFAGSGVSVAFLVTEAPQWAEAKGGPARYVQAGAWKPNARALGQFATALARRYSGRYADPLQPSRTLPRVGVFQAWAEANFSVHLAPQWTRAHGVYAPTGALQYRTMLNAFYAGIKRGDRSAEVIATGLGPYGDPPGGSRMPPAEFARELMCLSGPALHHEACPDPPHFDVFAADPYEVAGPTTPALNADDVSAPDLGKLTRVVKAAVASGRALPRTRKPLWVTEFSYDSNPPNPTAPSTATQARWLEQSFYTFWNEGVSTVIWYLIRDSAGHDYANSYFSGVYFRGGQPKPSYEAYRFPFVVATTARGHRAWGIAPRTGRLAVQRRAGRGWRTVFTVRVRSGAVFVSPMTAVAGDYRAVVGGEASLAWHV